MKIAIVGSRNLFVNLEKYLSDYDIDYIVSGGAKGIDSCAEDYAIKNNIKTIIFKPDYESFGKRAPLVRNIQIVEEADIVIAFWDGKSRGTLFTIKEARKKGKELKIYTNSP